MGTVRRSSSRQLELMYHQCHLRRGNDKQVTWVPAEFAEKGKILRVKEKGKWEDGWKVTWVSQWPMSESVVLGIYGDYEAPSLGTQRYR